MDFFSSNKPATRASTPKLRTGKSYGKIYNWFPILDISNRRKKENTATASAASAASAEAKEPELSLNIVDNNPDNDDSGVATIIDPQPAEKEEKEKTRQMEGGPIRLIPNESNGTSTTASGEKPKTIIQENLKAIITPEIKKKTAFQNELAYLARSDAHHDLGKAITDTMYRKEENFKKVFDSGLPVPATVAFHEGNAFASVVVSATDAKGDTINIHTGHNQPEEYLKEALLAAPDCTRGNEEGKFSTFAIGAGGETFFKYRVVRFVTKCKMNSQANDEKGLETKAYTGEEFGRDFINNTKLCEDGNSAAFVVDYSQHHFLENLSTGKTDNNTQNYIYYLMTPEVVNDPAEKPNVNNKTLFGKNKAVQLVSCVEKDNGPISYTPFDPKDPLTSNNFFSKYNFTISPVQKIITKAKAERLIVNLNISYDNGDKKPLTDTIEDSHNENTITTVLGYIKNILKQLLSTGLKDADTFNFNSKVQQKRGGDWFQALTCLTAKNRTYNVVLGTDNLNDGRIPDCPVYLVTHDRIAVAYALLNGVNVIYVDYYGRIFVFKNGGDPALKSSGKPMEEILFEGIQKKYFTGGNENKEFEDLIKTAKFYNQKVHGFTTVGRTTIGFIQEQKNYFITEVEKINTDVSKLNLNDKTFQSIIATKLRDLFTNAVRLAFIHMNLIDISEYLQTVTTNKNIFNNDYNSTTPQTVAEFSKALNNIKGIKDRFGIIDDANSADFGSAISNWINTNSVKLDVNKAAKKILDGADKDNVIFNFDRFTSIFKSKNNSSEENKDERKTDKNIFLPFIQVLPDDDKQQIFGAINVFAKKISDYYNAYNEQINKQGRSGTTSQGNFYNSVANLLYESILFLKPKETTNNFQKAAVGGAVEFYIDNIKLPDVISTSTDNIVLQEDLADLTVLKSNDGKFSGNDIEDEIEDENTSQTASSGRGGSLKGGTAFADVKNFKIGSTNISDVSVKQITWPLISSSLIDMSNPESLADFFKEIPTYINGLNEDRDPTENHDLLQSVLDKIIAFIGEIKAADPDYHADIMQMLEQEQIKIKIADITRISGVLLGIVQANMGGGGDSSSSSLPTVSKDLMKDFNFGFHPLVPIYAMLTSYYSIIGHKSQSDPFFYTYFTYVNVLEKMKKVLEEKYLDNTLNSPKTASAYIIGLGLYNMIFASHTSILQHNTILKMINMSQSDYAEFSLKNDGFVSSFSGAIHQTPEEEIIGSVLLDNPLFNNFINNEVNIKQIMEEGTPVENLPTFEVLQERMFKLMGEIVVKVNADRGTPIGLTTGLASGVASRTPAKFFLMPNEPQKQMVYATSSTSSRRGGRKRSKRYLNNKRKTIKKRVNKKTSKNTTKKRYRRPRRTRRV